MNVNSILSAQQIRKRLRDECGKELTLFHIHSIMHGLGYRKIRIGRKIGYPINSFRRILAYVEKYQDYQPSMVDNYFMYNGERDNRDYAWESKIRRCIVEAIDELDLYHGTPHEFDEFDLAYLSTGFGQQSHGYGVYLTTSVVTAKAYSQGKNIYTVEVPDGKYLNYDKIGRTEAMQIARKFFKYYTTKHEYGKEAYRGHENEFWEYECKYLGECTDGGSIYGTIASLLGDDKDTSEFLYRIGYKGMFLKCTNTDTKEKFKNYIIFNPKEIKILKKEKV